VNKSKATSRILSRVDAAACSPLPGPPLGWPLLPWPPLGWPLLSWPSLGRSSRAGALVAASGAFACVTDQF
jgi:hypothetical protein